MDWSALFSMQKKLDLYIEENNNLKTEDLFEEKYLALLVELGELANETRCFKFWSNKPRSGNDIVLEEYVDGIHFILSLGLEKGLSYQQEDDSFKDNLTETSSFNKVFKQCVAFHSNPDQERYNKLFTSYLMLGNTLGFSDQDIQLAYLKKNEINYERQDQGY